MNRLRRIVLEELSKVAEGDVIPFHPRPSGEKPKEVSDFDRIFNSIKGQLVSIEKQLEDAINEFGPKMKEDEEVALMSLLYAVQDAIDVDTKGEMSLESEDFEHDDG